MKANIQTELEAQQSAVFLWKAGNIAALLLWLIVGYCGHPLVMFILIAGQGINWLIKWGPMRDALIERQKVVALKQQTDNILVMSNHETDDTVAAYFEKALLRLKQVGNPHGVKVHMIIFRDVRIFSAWWDEKGNRQDESVLREKGSSFESWDQYQQVCNEFYLNDRDDRLREIRKGKAGKAWVDENIFKQQLHADN